MPAETVSPRAESVNEEWRPVVGFEGLYEVSDSGQVRVDVTATKTRRVRPGRLLAQRIPKGDTHFAIGLTRGGKTHTRFVHTLVALAFLGHRPDGYDVHHKNELPTDNHSSNLEYKPHGEHSAVHFASNPIRTFKGERHWKAKLTALEASAIKRLAATGVGSTELSRRFGISRWTVRCIIAGKAWKEAI